MGIRTLRNTYVRIKYSTYVLYTDTYVRRIYISFMKTFLVVHVVLGAHINRQSGSLEAGFLGGFDCMTNLHTGS